jgi:Pentapeptide repeats (8 copies)
MTYNVSTRLPIILASHRRWLETNGLAGKQARLIGKDLRGVNLSGANLSLADLYEADLSRANLANANLRGANLYKAWLARANLRDAHLALANLKDANLRGTRGILSRRVAFLRYPHVFDRLYLHDGGIYGVRVFFGAYNMTVDHALAHWARHSPSQEGESAIDALRHLIEDAIVVGASDPSAWQKAPSALAVLDETLNAPTQRNRCHISPPIRPRVSLG